MTNLTGIGFLGGSALSSGDFRFIDADTGFADGGSNSITWSHTTTVDTSMLVVSTGATSTSTSPLHPASSVTFNGVALTQVDAYTINVGSSSRHISLWYLVSPPIGTFNVVVTYVPNVNRFSGGIGMNFGGVNSLDVFDHGSVSDPITLTPTKPSIIVSAVHLDSDINVSIQGTWAGITTAGIAEAVNGVNNWNGIEHGYYVLLEPSLYSFTYTVSNIAHLTFGAIMAAAFVSSP